MADFFSNLFGGGAEKEAANKNREAYQNYWDTGINIQNTGVTDARNSLNNALGSYGDLSSLAGNYRQGSDLYLNALGVNGATNAARAQQSFTNNPGYEAGVDAGLDAINRRRSLSGMAQSGNADVDALQFGQNLQNQQYNSWLDRLGGVNQNALQATGAVAGGQAGVYGSLADLSSQDAQNRIGLLGNLTSGNVSANNLQAQGEAQGSRNLLGLGTSLASLASGGLGGGLGSSLSGLF